MDIECAKLVLGWIHVSAGQDPIGSTFGKQGLMGSSWLRGGPTLCFWPYSHEVNLPCSQNAALTGRSYFLHTVSPPPTPLRKHLLSGIKHCKIWREGFFFVVCEECCCVGIFGRGGAGRTRVHISVMLSGQCGTLRCTESVPKRNLGSECRNSACTQNPQLLVY